MGCRSISRPMASRVSVVRIFVYGGVVAVLVVVVVMVVVVVLLLILAQLPEPEQAARQVAAAAEQHYHPTCTVLREILLIVSMNFKFSYFLVAKRADFKDL